MKISPAESIAIPYGWFRTAPETRAVHNAGIAEYASERRHRTGGGDLANSVALKIGHVHVASAGYPNAHGIREPRTAPGACMSLRERLCRSNYPCLLRSNAQSVFNPIFFGIRVAYVLGRTAGEGKRTADEHAKFKEMHAALLAGSEDAGLVALRHFLEKWSPEHFNAPPFSPDMLDANIVFCLDGDLGYLHDQLRRQGSGGRRRGSRRRASFLPRYRPQSRAAAPASDD